MIHPRDWLLYRRTFRNRDQNREAFSNHLFPRRSCNPQGRKTRVIFEKYPLDITWPNSQDRWLPIEGKGCGTSGSPRIRREKEKERERKIRVSRSTRIIGSGWKQRNPLIETWPPRRFNDLSRIPIYVTVIKGGGAQTCGPSFVNS